VTNAEYAIFVEETGKEPPRHWEGGRIPAGKDEHPVVHVSWTDAVAFCEWLSRRISKDEDPHLVRLPTEAEWEYAARGEGGRKYPWGDAEPSDRLANFGRNVGDTTPVGSYPDGATPEGVHDLAGNVWEWCGDWTGRYPPEDEEDPTGPHSGASRVLRGGAFLNFPWNLRAAYRGDRHPEARFDRLGFRVCCGWSRGL
jgi:serine/threonine-protein kinase